MAAGVQDRISVLIEQLDGYAVDARLIGVEHTIVIDVDDTRRR